HREFTIALIDEHAKVRRRVVRAGFNDGDICEAISTEVAGRERVNGPVWISQRAIDGLALKRSIAVSQVDPVRSNQIRDSASEKVTRSNLVKAENQTGNSFKRRRRWLDVGFELE